MIRHDTCCCMNLVEDDEEDAIALEWMLTFVLEDISIFFSPSPETKSGSTNVTACKPFCF